MCKLKTKIIAVVIGLLAAIVVTNPSVTTAPSAMAEVRAIPETVEEWIDYYAQVYNANAQELKKVVFCESGNRIAVYGDGGRAFGPAQFHKPTFTRWTKQLGENLDYYNYQHQLKLMAWAFSKGEAYKDDWTCWTKLYNYPH